MLRVRPAGVLLRELRSQRKRDQGKDNEPARVNVDGDAKDVADPQTRGACHT
jgi:hypothetical protein